MTLKNFPVLACISLLFALLIVPGPTTSSAQTHATPTDEFFTKADQFHETVEAKFKSGIPKAKYPALQEKLVIALSKQRAVLTSLQKQVKELSPGQRSNFESVIESSGIVPIFEEGTKIVRTGSPTAALLKLVSSIMEGMGMSLEASPFLGDLGKEFEEVGHIEGDIGEFQDDDLENKIDHVENKLDDPVSGLRALKNVLDVMSDFDVDTSRRVTLTDLERRLDFIMDCPPDPSLGVCRVPQPRTGPSGKPVSLTDLAEQLEKTKKFFKTELTFCQNPQPVPQSLTIPVDMSEGGGIVTGWIDLTNMRGGPGPGNTDIIVVKTLVSVGTQEREWSKIVFTGLQARGLKEFRDFADGLSEVPGKFVTILIEQEGSASGGCIAVPVQFIIEARVEHRLHQ